MSVAYYKIYSNYRVKKWVKHNEDWQTSGIDWLFRTNDSLL